MKRILLLIIIMFSLSLAAGAFESETMQQLWDVPTGEVKAQTIKTYNQGGVRVEEIYYLSRSFKREPVKIFGYFAYPLKRSGRLPAILLSHGGGGTASRPRVVAWARRGYAVLAIDLPGKGENRAGSRSTGPDMIVPNLLRTQPDPSYNYLIHAVAAARNGITFLSRRKEVDPERIGMIGLSWGGVLTLLTNGQDKRLKAAVNVFGAGYIPEGCTWEDRFYSMPANDKEIWDTYLDPKNFLASQHAPILFITGTNDHCYYLPTFQKSYDQVLADKNYYLIPNLRHRFLDSAQGPALAWLDQRLKKAGDLFPKIIEAPIFQKSVDKIIIPVRAQVVGAAKSLRLYYTEGGPLQWTAKKWKEIEPYYKSGVYYFSVPTGLLRPEIIYYVSVRDNRGGASSSLVKSLFAVKQKGGGLTYGISSTIRKTFRHEKPITLLSGADASHAWFYYSKKDNVYEMFGAQ